MHKLFNIYCNSVDINMIVCRSQKWVYKCFVIDSVQMFLRHFSHVVINILTYQYYHIEWTFSIQSWHFSEQRNVDHLEEEWLLLYVTMLLVRRWTLTLFHRRQRPSEFLCTHALCHHYIRLTCWCTWTDLLCGCPLGGRITSYPLFVCPSVRLFHANH